MLALPNCGAGAYQRSGTAGAKPKWAGGGGLLNVSGALSCIRRVREHAQKSNLAVPPALLVTDAPGLQSHLLARSESGEGDVRATDGVGVDPTNDERRDAAAGEARNLRKVASDFYLQGFCACSLTLMPSTFYGSASLRGAATRPPPADGVVSRALCARLAPSCPWDKA